MDFNTLLAQSTNNINSVKENEEKFVTNYRINVVQIIKDESLPKGYRTIPLPFGMPLELNPKSRKQQSPEAIKFMDKLLSVAKKLPEGESVEVFTKDGNLAIQVRHTKPREDLVIEAEEQASFDAIFGL